MLTRKGTVGTLEVPHELPWVQGQSQAKIRSTEQGIEARPAGAEDRWLSPPTARGYRLSEKTASGLVTTVGTQHLSSVSTQKERRRRKRDRSPAAAT